MRKLTVSTYYELSDNEYKLYIEGLRTQLSDELVDLLVENGKITWSSPGPEKSIATTTYQVLE